MKSFKNLFIKDDEKEQEPTDSKVSFPVSEGSSPGPKTTAKDNPYLEEILSVYEHGLEKLNMPGYDFYDFFTAIKAAGAQSESVFKMAYQMGKTLDSTITPQKLIADAEFYISKINDVHQTYSSQGKKKLDDLDSKLRLDRDKLTNEAQRIEADIASMKQQIQAAETRLQQTKSDLGKIEEVYKPEENEVKLKLLANDEAMQVSIKKLNVIKESILKYLK